MLQLRELARSLGELKAIWVEDKPDTVMGWTLALARKVQPSIQCVTVSSPEEFERLFAPDQHSGLIFDVKLQDRRDGISLANSVRDGYPILPIRFVTSFLHEYSERLQRVPRTNGIHGRDTLQGVVFDNFCAGFSAEVCAFRVFNHYRLGEMPITDFLKLPFQDALLQAHQVLFGKWTEQVMSENNYCWVAVFGTETIWGSESFVDYPTFDEKLELAKRYGAVPFVYARPIVSEEQLQSLGLLLSHYPRLQIWVDGRSGIADLDTGTNFTLVSDELADQEPLSTIQQGRHFGVDYSYRVNAKLLTVTGLDDGGSGVGPLRMPVAVVNNWDKSPWVRVNPDRHALLGRDLFAARKLEIKILSSADQQSVQTSVRDVFDDES